MQNVLLAIHLILAVVLIALVLLQRSEGGALGMGGGGGGLVSARGAATALTKATWITATSFIAVSLMLTWLAAQDRKTDSILDQPATAVPAGDAPLAPPVPGVVPAPAPAPATNQ